LKKWICALLALLILLCAAPAALATFDPEAETSTKHIVLMDANSGSVLYEKNGEDRAYPASTTKIMTCILALENGNLDDKVTVGDEVQRGFYSQSSMMGLHPGETLTLRDLIYGLMLISGNDAAAAIAVHISGSTEAFAELMNQKAASLGMNDTHFVNPHGVHKEDHYTTAHDMARLAAYALQNADFRAIVSKGSYNVPATNKDKDGYQLENSNKLVHTKSDSSDSYEYRYAIGIKTGDTDAAGRCLIAAAEKDGVTLVSVQYNDPDSNYRFKLAADLFDWGFANFSTVDASTLGLPSTVDVTVKNCSFDDETDGLLTLNVDLTDKKIARLSSELNRIKDSVSSITTSVATIGELTAPVKKGDKLATVSYQFEGKTLFTADAYASRDVQAMGGGVVNTPGVPQLENPTPRGGSAGPWLFIILVAVVILLIVVGIAALRNRRSVRRRRSRRATTYAYRGRR
jgi:D-alanyl-D-alanine carboxypeptidase (penicillin-binding protein 5/6)